MVVGGGKLAWGCKCTKIEGKAEEPVVGPSQVKKQKAVVVLPPAPMSRMYFGEGRSCKQNVHKDRF